MCGEVVISDEFYFYDIKYINEIGVKVIIFVLIDSVVSDNIWVVVLVVFCVFECCGMVWVDVFLIVDNIIIINEINIFSGFINISMYFKLWCVIGVGLMELIIILIELVLECY